MLHRLSHSDYTDLNSNAIDNNNANENDSCYDLGTGGGGLAALYCTVAAQTQKRAKLNCIMQRRKLDRIRV